MTIARRLILLVAVPLMILIGLGVLSSVELARVKARARYLADTQVQSLAATGHISRTVTEMRVNARSYLFATNDAEHTRAKADFDNGKAKLADLFQRYADSLITDAQD